MRNLPTQRFGVKQFMEQVRMEFHLILKNKINLYVHLVVILSRNMKLKLKKCSLKPKLDVKRGRMIKEDHLQLQRLALVTHYDTKKAEQINNYLYIYRTFERLALNITSPDHEKLDVPLGIFK